MNNKTISRRSGFSFVKKRPNKGKVQRSFLRGGNNRRKKRKVPGFTGPVAGGVKIL